MIKFIINDLTFSSPKNIIMLRTNIRRKGQSYENFTLSKAKIKLGSIIELLCLTVMITKNGHPAAILISPDEFESWKETIAVLSDRNLMADIRKGLSDLEKSASAA